MREISTWKSVRFYAAANGVPRRSFYVAIIVGTILNLINQGDALLGGTNVSWIKVVLTYFVPYVVCTYGAVTAQLSAYKSTSPTETQHAANS